MTELVKEDALAKIWCSPEQDRLVVVKPIKVSPAGGFYRAAKVIWDTIDLPTKEYYHVYQIGQVPAALYNLPNEMRVWMPVTTICSDRSIVSRVYSEEGLVYPLGLAFLYITRDRNLLLALKIDRKHPIDLETSTIWFNLYSNAFYYSQRWYDLKTQISKPAANPVTVVSRYLANQNDITAFRNAVANAINNSAITADKVTYIVNGRYVSDISLVTAIKIGDYVDALVDSSVKIIRTTKTSEMASFISTVDTITKRLFPPVKDITTIDFIDDIDFYIGRVANGKISDAVFYNQHREDSVRMVTHNSYSLSDVQLDAQIDDDAVFVDETETYVIAMVRHAGYRRPLLTETRRITELYKLSEGDIFDAMTGVDSLVPEWLAENLEASDYTKVISSEYSAITDTMAENAYGYNLIAKTFCETYPTIFTDNNQKKFNKPIGFDDCVVTTYNQGQLVVTENGGNGAIIPVPEPQIAINVVELTPGEIFKDNNASRYYGKPVVTFDKSIHDIGFRCYTCPIVSNLPNEQWVDVTATTAYYSISNDGKTFTWNMTTLNGLGLYPLLYVGGEVIWRKAEFDTDWDGNLSFQIYTYQWYSPVWPLSQYANPVLREAILRIPTGNLDLFMDKRPLIEGLDYKVDWPLVTILRKPARNPSEGLEVYYRAYGFCKTNLTREAPREFGYVESGILSANNQRNLRDDRNYRLIIDGTLYKREDVKFSEDGWPLVNSVLNGKPYGISDMVMPIDGFTTKETYAFREISKEIDTRVGQYMTTKNPGTPPPVQNPIVSKYDLFSPFCSTIIYRLKNGWLNGLLNQPYDNTDIAEWIGDFENLLEYDPCLDLSLDMRYIYIRPHLYNVTQTLTSVQYSFVEKVIRDYLTPLNYPPRLDLTAYVRIQG